MCKVLMILALLALLILFTGSTNAQEVFWDANIPLSYLWYDGGTYKIIPNIPIVIEIEAENNSPTAVQGFNVPWHVFGVGDVNTVNWINAGGTHGINSVVLTNGFEDNTTWNLLNIITPWSWDGTLPDTLSHTAVMTSGPGWPAYSPMETHYEFHLSIPLNPGELGEICIDSINHWNDYYDWVFDRPSNFMGPYCWEVEVNPNSPPDIVGTPTSLACEHHEYINVTYDIFDPESDAITGVGVVDNSGIPLGATTLVNNGGVYSLIWDFDPPCSWVGQSNDIYLYAEDASHAYPNSVNLYCIDLAIVNSAPVIGGDCGKTFSVKANSTGTASFTATDANISSPEEILLYTVNAYPSPNGMATIDPNGIFVFGPTTLDVGQIFTFTIRVTDCTGDNSECDVAFQVTNVDDLGLRPNPDGWQFSNSSINMWPSSWWTQFDYTLPPYPPAFWAVAPDSFPDWPLFVDAFGKSQCYLYTAPGTITFRPTAITKWQSIIGPWGGSCFGFAITSFLYFDGFLEVSKTFPGNADVYNIPIADSSRKLVNKYWIYQTGKYHRQHVLNNYASTVNQTLLECRNMFNNPVRDDKILAMYNNNGSGGHAVTPYRCETDPINTHIWYIYVYDNNYPNDDTKRIEVNTITNLWHYSALPTWGGQWYLFLMEPISFYTSNPIRSDSASRGNREDNVELLWDDEHIELYFSQVDSAFLESPSGNIGHYEDNKFSTITNGMPMILLTGQETPTKGYYLPNDNWDYYLTGMLYSSFRMSMFSSSTVWTYQRENVDYTQHEHLRIENGNQNLMIYNPDLAGRNYQLDIIEAAIDSEVVWTVSAIELAAEDSTGFSIIAGERQDILMQIDNYGEAGTYNLGTKIAGYSGEYDFFSDAISIPENSSQRIIPDGRAYDNTVMIITDPDMTGIYTDTGYVENEYGITYICGDVNHDELINILDIVYLINYKYKEGPDPISMNAADVNSDELINILDIVYLINYKYKEGPDPVCP